MPEKLNSAKLNIMKLRNGKTVEMSKKKYVSSSDDDSSSWIDEEDDYDSEDDEFDVKEFRHLLAEL